MLVAKNSFVTTYFYPKSKILVSVYTGRSNIELGLSHLKKVVGFYDKNEVRGPLVDITNVTQNKVKTSVAA